MPSYIHNKKDWPKFRWDSDIILSKLSSVRNNQGRLTGKMDALGFNLQNEAYLISLSEDVLKSSEIEGEVLDPNQVRSSIARKLGLDIAGSVLSDKNVDGVVEMMIDATKKWQSPLTKNRLFAWHSALFPSGRSGMYKIIVGNWRNDSTGPMQVVSGPMSKETVHFEAPAASRIDQEMENFLHWVNSPNRVDPVLRAAIAHIWFVTIHPFEDGNGRIARAITDLMLCQSEKKEQRFYSLSSEIKDQKSKYYNILEETQKGTMDITDWLLWFLSCLENAIESSNISVNKILRKHKFWNDHKHVTFNKRQIKIIELIFNNFFGNLTTSKWAKINKCSPDTALRDIQELITKNILRKSKSGGRSTNYEMID